MTPTEYFNTTRGHYLTTGYRYRLPITEFDVNFEFQYGCVPVPKMEGKNVRFDGYWV